jgi:ubiquinone/menaquinone biosynthesis C-methylase UbiE
VPDNIVTIVDIGGGSGQLIPELTTRDMGGIEKYVLDISNIDTISGVKKISSLNEIGKIDLVIYSHIIEHVPDPLSELARILQHTDYIYIETPYGIPKISFVNKSIFISIFFALLSMHPLFWRNMFSLSVGLKSKKNILTQSEHINFFETSTIKKLAELSNCNSVIKLNSINNPLGEKHQVIQALFSKRII